MIKKVIVINHLGDTLEMELRNPEKSGFAIRKIDGLGSVKADINTTVSTLSDGSVYNSARLTERNIVFDLVFISNKDETIEDIRLKSYKFFPIKRLVTILIETENRTVFTQGYVETNEPNIFSSMESASISILCPSSYFYDITTNKVIVFGTDSEFEFPFSNEVELGNNIEMGDIKTIPEGEVIYTGDIETGFVVNIHAIGEATNLTMYDTKTRQYIKIYSDKLLELTGSNITAGDEIVINTALDERSIALLRDGKTINIINCADRFIQWLQLCKGANKFVFTTDDGIENLEISISNRIVYEGV